MMLQRPLLVWKVVFAITLPVMIFFCVVDPVIISSRERISVALSRVHSSSFPRNKGAVIFVGSSRLADALPDSENEFYRLFQDEMRKLKPGAKATVLQNLSTRGSQPVDLQHLINEVIQTAPALLVMQVDIFINNKREKRGLKQLWDWSMLIRNWLKEVWSVTEDAFEDNLSMNESDWPDQTSESSIESQQLKTIRAWKRDNVFWESSDYLAGQTLIAKANSRGIKVILIEAPISQTMFSAASKNYFAERDRAIASLLKNHGEVVRYPGPIPDKYFMDFRHLNEEGKTLYVPVVVHEIAKRILN